MKSGLDLITDFGGTDADGDALLAACFESHPAYLEIRAHRKNLIRGRKGAGKTAIFQRLLRDAGPLVYANGYSFEDYPWHHHAFQEETGVPAERRYVHSWRYLILLGLTQMVLAEAQKEYWTEDPAVWKALTSLESFMVDSYGSIKPGLNELFNPRRQIKLRTSVNVGVLKVDGERVPMDQFPTHIQAVNRQIEEDLFAAMNPNAEYFTCFDQLDHGFSTSDPTYHDRISGLLIAARGLFVSAHKKAIRFNPVVFLRDDIFESLKFEDRNRIRTDSFVLEWKPDADGVSLRSLMENRFREVLGTDEKPDYAWSDVFDETEVMTGRQSKLSHIADRTYLRPRDMIRFCNEILRSHQETKNPASKITNSDIIHARASYSPYLLDELDDEINKQVPHYRDYMKVIEEIGSEKFGFEEFKIGLEKRRPMDSTEEVLRNLFTFSIVGYLKPGGAGGGSAWVWRYMDSRAAFDVHALSFRTHRGLKETLDLHR